VQKKIEEKEKFFKFTEKYGKGIAGFKDIKGTTFASLKDLV